LAYLDFVSHSAAQTQRLGARLGELLERGDVILLQGGLGAGKTVFAQGVAQGLGVVERVTSPTFTLVHEYEGRLPLYHIDLFRLAGDVEAGAIGLEEYLWGDGVTIIEWPERARGLLTPAYLMVGLRQIADTKRALRFEPKGKRYLEMLTLFKRVAFGL
jgi:tRNA threonylcarbamoyladenosine biosynthesis protein TsaE